MTLFLSILFIFIASVCKSLADTLDHHFDTSIFKNKPRKWYDPNVIIKTAPQIFGYPLDVWHVANTIQIAAWFGLTVVYRQVLPEWWMDYCAGGIIFIIVFNIFYNKIFR